MFRRVPLSIIRNFSLYTQQCYMSANAWMVSPYTQHNNWQLSTVQPAHTTPPPLGWCHHIHSISTGNSLKHINSQLSTVQPAHTTPPPLGWCHHIHSISTHNSLKHINSQLSTVQPAHTTPHPLGWCHHIHSISTGNSVQCN